MIQPALPIGIIIVLDAPMIFPRLFLNNLVTYQVSTTRQLLIFTQEGSQGFPGQKRQSQRKGNTYTLKEPGHNKALTTAFTKILVCMFECAKLHNQHPHVNNCHLFVYMKTDLIYYSTNLGHFSPVKHLTCSLLSIKLYSFAFTFIDLKFS